MNSTVRKPVLFFSSLVHGGGRTFAEAYAESIRDAEITLCTLYDKAFTKTLAERLGSRACSIFDPRLLLDPRTLVFSNSQACAAIAALLYPRRHYYVTHGYANGLPYAQQWRRRVWAAQVNIPGTKIIACGDAERDAISALLLNKKKVSLIRNGLPQKVIQGAVAPKGAVDSTVQGVHLAYIGRITFQKGLDVLLRALELPELRQHKIRLSIIGNYQDHEVQYCAQVRELIQRSQATIELIPPQQIDAAFFRRFSALVAPSRFEGLPYTILEAAYAGTPILLSDCPGNCDIAPDDRYAFTFESENEVSLAHALLGFIESNADEIDKRVSLMQQRVINEFSSSSFRDAYLKLLH
jgi:glycosyltransferase involved in cell wall biosynthesis